MYVGTDDHRVRPFLRVGTSPHLPDRIRPYIGTVVLSDRITGNPLNEAETVGPQGVRSPEYAGSPELVRALSPLTGMDRVPQRPISATHQELAEGAFVEFLTDGNLHLTVNGHRIFELDQVEQADHHAAYLLDRVLDTVRGSGGAYDPAVFEPPGFLVGTDRSLYRFARGELAATALQSGAVAALARRMIDPELLTAVAGPADSGELLRWGKWRLRRALLGESSQPVTVAEDAAAGGSRRLEHLLAVLRVAGVPLENAPVRREFDLPGIPGEPGPAVLYPPGRGEWPTIPTAILDGAVPLVPGVPYRVFGAEDDLPAAGDVGVESACGELMEFLRRWNADAPEQFVQRATELLTACPAPVWADLYPSGEGYSVRFMVQHGFSPKYARQNLAAVERIDTALRDRSEEGEAFRAEQRRLLGFLDELLEQRRATTRAPATGPGPGPEPAKSVDPKAEAGHPARSPSGPSADQSGRSEPAPRESRRFSRPARSTRSTRSTRSGTSERRIRLGWRGPLYVVIGIVLIAGAVGLLVWRDDTGERYLARLGARSEVELPAEEGGASDPESEAPSPENGRAAPAAAEEDPAEEDPAPENARAPAEDNPTGEDALVAEENPTGEEAPGADQPAAAADPETATRGVADPLGESVPGEGAAADTERAAPAPENARAPAEDNPTGEDALVADQPAVTDEAVAIEEPAAADEPTAEPTQPDPASTGAPPAPDRRRTDIDAETPTIVTAADILRLVNRIAERNGYALIGAIVPGGRDPDWIFPGNQLVLPDQHLYEIQVGDTMWEIADRFIRQSAHDHMRTLVDVAERIERGERPTEELQVLRDEAYAEATRRRAEELLDEIEIE